MVDELVRSFTAPANEHKTKAGNIRLKDRLYSAVASAMKASAAPVTVFDFTIMMGEEMGEIEQVHQTSVSMGLIGPKDRRQPKGSSGQQPSGSATSQEAKSCHGCGGDKHLAKDCKLKEHPDFNKEGSWEASEAYKALKLRFPNTRSAIRLHHKYRVDGTPLEKPFSRPGKLGKDGKPFHKKTHSGEHVVYSNIAATASTTSSRAVDAGGMYRQCVIPMLPIAALLESCLTLAPSLTHLLVKK